MRAVDDERDDPADGRIEEPVAEPSDSRQDDKRAQPEMAARVERGDCPDRKKRQTSDRIIIRRRSYRSASAPPINSVVSRPAPWTARTRPILPAPAIVNVFQPSAVRKAASPTSETAWPVNNSRKSRCRSA